MDKTQLVEFSYNHSSSQMYSHDKSLMLSMVLKAEMCDSCSVEQFHQHLFLHSTSRSLNSPCQKENMSLSCEHKLSFFARDPYIMCKRKKYSIL